MCLTGYESVIIELINRNCYIPQVMNIILRRCMGMLDLVLLKRDFFDKNAAQEIPVNNFTLC